MNNLEQNVEVQEKEYSKKSNKSKIIIFLLSVLVLGLLALCVYNNYQLKQEKEKNNSEESTNTPVDNKKDENQVSSDEEKKLDINSSKVLNLYMLVKDLKGGYSNINDNIAYEKELTADNIDYRTKFYLALRLSESDNVKCNDYISDISKGYNLYGEVEFGCGNEIYNYFDKNKGKFENSLDTIALTKVYKKDEIKKRMHQIFGKDYYQDKDKIDFAGYDYYYVNKLNGYIIIITPTGGIEPSCNPVLESAIQTRDSIIIYEKAAFNNGSIDEKDLVFNYKYTFKYNQSDDSYYFDKLEQELVK